MRESNFPAGWDERRVREVIRHYESQTEGEAIAEDEAAFDSDRETFVAVPNELLPEVRQLIARHQSS